MGIKSKKSKTAKAVTKTTESVSKSGGKSEAKTVSKKSESVFSKHANSAKSAKVSKTMTMDSDSDQDSDEEDQEQSDAEGESDLDAEEDSVEGENSDSEESGSTKSKDDEEDSEDEENSDDANSDKSENESENSEDSDNDSEIAQFSSSWDAFGTRFLDRRLTKALTKTLKLEKPTQVQCKTIPIALTGRDILLHARTGSGKTLAYLIPIVNRLLQEAENNENNNVDNNNSTTSKLLNINNDITSTSSNANSTCKALILVPSSELCTQVHQVLTELLSFSYDVISHDIVLKNKSISLNNASNLKSNGELPTILIGTPTSVLETLKVRSQKLTSLKSLIVDEADLMNAYDYDDAINNLKGGFLPNRYQCMLCSATLANEGKDSGKNDDANGDSSSSSLSLAKSMLHDPVVLKLDNERKDQSGLTSGVLTQFYLPIDAKKDRMLVLYSLIRLKIVSGKILIFCKDIDSAYQLRLFLEKFGINSAVLNSELSFESRQNIIQSFNQGIMNIVIATDEGMENQTNFQEEEDNDDNNDSDADSDNASDKDSDNDNSDDDSDSLDLDHEYQSDSEEKRLEEKRNRPSTLHIDAGEAEIGSKKVHSEEIKKLKAMNSRKQKQFMKRKEEEERKKKEEEMMDSDDDEDGDEVGEKDKSDKSGSDSDSGIDSDFGEEFSDIEGSETTKASKDKKKKTKSNDDDEEDSDDDDDKLLQKMADESDDDDDEEDDDEEPDSDVDMSKTKNKSKDSKKKNSIEALTLSRREKQQANKSSKHQFSVSRGLDFQHVGTVINADMPRTLKAYVHRVGRTARGGEDGTALTLVDEEDDRQMTMMNVIIENKEKLFGSGRHRNKNKKSKKSVTESESNEDESNNNISIDKLPFDINYIERLRYRVEDIARSVTKKSIRAMRLREVQQEAVNSQKLKSHFADNPLDRIALQKAQRQLKQGQKGVQKHLQYLPGYLIPTGLINATSSNSSCNNPAKSAILEAKCQQLNVTGNSSKSGLIRNDASLALSQTNLSSNNERLARSHALNGNFDSNPSSSKTSGSVIGAKRKGGKARITLEQMENIAKRQESKDVGGFADPDRLAPLSGRKIWKMNHGKRLSKKKNSGSSFSFGGRKMGKSAAKRKRIFPNIK